MGAQSIRKPRPRPCFHTWARTTLWLRFEENLSTAIRLVFTVKQDEQHAPAQQRIKNTHGDTELDAIKVRLDLDGQMHLFLGVNIETLGSTTRQPCALHAGAPVLLLCPNVPEIAICRVTHPSSVTGRVVTARSRRVEI